MQKKSQGKEKLNFLLFIVSVIWILYGIFFVYSDFKQNYQNYRILFPLSLSGDGCYLKYMRNSVNFN